MTPCVKYSLKVCIVAINDEYNDDDDILVSTCTYVNYSRAGGQNMFNALCVLSLNMINDKVGVMCYCQAQLQLELRQD